MNQMVEYKKNASPVGIAWLKFLTYIRFPLFWISLFSYIDEAIIISQTGISSLQPIASLSVLFVVILVPLSIFTFIQMKNLTCFGYRFFFVFEAVRFLGNLIPSLVITSVYSNYNNIVMNNYLFSNRNLVDINSLYRSMLASVLGFVIWIIPNFIYMKKRKFLFEEENFESALKDKISEVESKKKNKKIHNKEPKPGPKPHRLINYCNNCGAELPIMGDYCNQCGAKKLTESDIQTKEKK